MKTFFFYDLETSGFSPRRDRIMQFAGQRTDMDLNPVGEPVNILVALNDDVLPSPGALMVTKISPQQTVEEGYTEAEFAKMCVEEFFTPDTIAVGYNNIRFDDEHMRHLFWRNFFDPYEWQWKDGRSRWDFLDVVRMVRALRPDGINWPFVENPETGEKFPSNKLELLTKENGIEHENAHDALADVIGLIEVAKILKKSQPKMFDFLFKMREKSEVQKLVNLENPAPFVYTSGRFSAEFEKTSPAQIVTPAPNRNAVIWDLRISPEPFLRMSVEEIIDNLENSWSERDNTDFLPIPAKILQYNRCPAVAPFGVLTEENLQRLKIDKAEILKNSEILKKNPVFAENLRTAFENRDENFKSQNNGEEKQPEEQLYDGFLPDGDKKKVEAVRNATARQLADFNPEFADERLAKLLPRYKARSFPKSLTSDEKAAWQKYRAENLQKMLPQFLKEMEEASARTDLTKAQENILVDLKLWLENVMPENDF